MQARSDSTRTAARYSHPAIALHWLLALLIAVQVGLGWYMLSIEKQPGSGWYFALHVSLGLTAAALIGLRMAWRIGNPPDPLPASVPPWQMSAIRMSHRLLYTLMFLMPLTGYLGAAFSGDGVSYFGLPLPDWASPNDAWKERFFGLHSIIAWTLVGLVGLHVLGALKHLLIDKDGVFWRMWPR